MTKTREEIKPCGGARKVGAGVRFLEASLLKQGPWT